eukprot:12404871-Karenia_brevis.AAC.1
MGVVWKDVDKPVALPAWHCAFQGCYACSEKWQERNNHQHDLWQHVWSAHQKDLRQIIVQFSVLDDFLDLKEVAFTLYSQALLESERESCPLLGAATDRRALSHLGE